MKINMKTLCSVGALMLCSESVLAIEAIPFEKSNSEKQNLAPMSYKTTNSLSTNKEESSSVMSSLEAGILTINPSQLKELASRSNEELSSIRRLHIEGYGIITSSQYEDMCSIVTRVENVEVLYLENLGLTDIPRVVFNRVGLKRLGLPNNNLTHIPSDIERLTKLGTLDICNNKNLTISSELDNLINLRVTNSSDCEIVGKEYGGLSVVNLSNKNLTHIPRDISYLANYEDAIKKLDLRNNDLEPKSFPIIWYN